MREALKCKIIVHGCLFVQAYCFYQIHIMITYLNIMYSMERFTPYEYTTKCNHTLLVTSSHNWLASFKG